MSFRPSKEPRGHWGSYFEIFIIFSWELCLFLYLLNEIFVQFTHVCSFSENNCRGKITIRSCVHFPENFSRIRTARRSYHARRRIEILRGSPSESRNSRRTRERKKRRALSRDRDLRKDGIILFVMSLWRYPRSKERGNEVRRADTCRAVSEATEASNNSCFVYLVRSTFR